MDTPGCVYGFEMTWSSRYGWHPHVHVVANIKWIEQRWLSKVWEEYTGAPIVDIVRIQREGLTEAVKYPVKPETLLAAPVSNLAKMTYEAKGLRWRGAPSLKASEKKIDENLKSDVVWLVVLEWKTRGHTGAAIDLACASNGISMERTEILKKEIQIPLKNTGITTWI